MLQPCINSGFFAIKGALSRNIFLSPTTKAWALYFESTFEFVIVNGTLEEVPYFLVTTNGIRLERYTQDYQLNYNRLAFGLGVRRYFHFEDEKSMFISGGILSNFAINFNRNLALGEYKENPVLGRLEVPLKEQHSIVVGLGVKVKKFTGEVRYNTKRNLAIGRRNYVVNLGGIVLLFGMQL